MSGYFFFFLRCGKMSSDGRESHTLYKQGFVISRGPARRLRSREWETTYSPLRFWTAISVTSTLNNFWWGYLTAPSLPDTVFCRRFFSAVRGLHRVLRISRLYLLHFGHRRVCSRAALWAINIFWSLYYFDRQSQWLPPLQPRGSPYQYSYRHLHVSTFVPAGLLLTQPNFYLFIYLLSNPYFWLVLQQSLNSVYRS